MRIFITGATGFIGTHLVQRLALTEHRLVCLVRQTSDVSTLKKVGAALVTGDVTDRDSLLQAMKGCCWVINLANVYSFWEPDRRIYSEVNVGGTRNVMEVALELGVAKVLHVSTALVYGKPADGPFTEESPVGPVRFSEYAETKYQGDLIAWELCEKKGLPLVVIYPAAVLGPGDPKASGQLIRSLIRRRLPATACHASIVTWVHVRDVAEAILRAMDKEDNLGEKYLVGREQLSMAQFYKTVSEISRVPLPRVHLPDSLAMASARLLTWLADLTKKPPLWGMAVDKISTIKEGFRCDGSKAERELGVIYTPIRLAIEGAIASYREGP
jgi:dihydroflavonol-4-reductase